MVLKLVLSVLIALLIVPTLAGDTTALALDTATTSLQNLPAYSRLTGQAISASTEETAPAEIPLTKPLVVFGDFVEDAVAALRTHLTITKDRVESKPIANIFGGDVHVGSKDSMVVAISLNFYFR